MANVHAAIKQIRKDSKKKIRNQDALSELKNLGAKLAQAPQQDAAKVKDLARELVSRWDRAVSRGIVPRGRADRKKARIAHFLNKLAR